MAAEVSRARRRSFLTMDLTYFIAADNGLIKIGSSQNPFERLRQLRTGSASRLQMITAVPAAEATELALHKRFREHRSHGEWFHPHPDLLSCIAGLIDKWGGTL